MFIEFNNIEIICSIGENTFGAVTGTRWQNVAPRKPNFRWHSLSTLCKSRIESQGVNATLILHPSCLICLISFLSKLKSKCEGRKKSHQYNFTVLYQALYLFFLEIVLKMQAYTTTFRLIWNPTQVTFDWLLYEHLIQGQLMLNSQHAEPITVPLLRLSKKMPWEFTSW